jgi:oligoribonuclease
MSVFSKPPQKDMRELVDYFHYRILDVSTIKELARRWYPAGAATR